MQIEHKAATCFQKVYFLFLAFFMNYCINGILSFKLSITYRHLFAVIIIVSGVICFLIRPNLARGFTAVKSSLVMGLPMFVMVLASMLVWFMDQSDIQVINRGLSYYFIFMNYFHAALAGAVLLYMFGEKGIWYNLVAIVAANLLMILQVILKNGIGSFVSEFVRLVVTFADDTGDVIRQAEVHELAFCLGAYLLYMMLYAKKNIVAAILFVLAGFCFTAAFKRIAVVAVAVALVFGYIMKFLKSKNKEQLVMRIIAITMVAAVFVLLFYVGIVKWGVFQKMEDAGIDTSGRADIYRSVDKYYEFSPRFIGNGMGFMTYMLNSGVDLGVTVKAIHNDFLDYYINIGFFGFIFWLLALTYVRVKYFGRKGFTDGAIVTASITLYVLIVSATDNTMNYQLFNTAVAIIIMGCGFDRRTAEEEQHIAKMQPRVHRRI